VLGNAARFFDAPVHDYYLVEGTPVILAYEKNGQYVTTIVREHVRNAPIEWTVHSMVVASTPANPFSVEHSSYRLVICDGFVLYDFGGATLQFLCSQSRWLAVSVLQRYYPIHDDQMKYLRDERQLVDRKYIFCLGREALSVAFTLNSVEFSVLFRQ